MQKRNWAKTCSKSTIKTLKQRLRTFLWCLYCCLSVGVYEWITKSISRFTSVVSFCFLGHIFVGGYSFTNKKEARCSLKVKEYLTPGNQKVPVSPKFHKIMKSSAIFQNFWGNWPRMNSRLTLGRHFLELIFWKHIKRGLTETNYVTVSSHHWLKWMLR